MLSVIQIIAVLLTFANVVVSSPVELQKRSTFSIEQVPAKVAHRKPGAVLKAAAFQRHGIPMHTSLQASAENAANRVLSHPPYNGSVSAWNDYYHVMYLCPVTIGEDTLHLLFDTGSSDIWGYSSLQPQEQIYGHEFYNAEQYKIKDGYTWGVTYVDGTGASGDVYVDQVEVGPLVATQQAFGAAKTISPSFVNFPEYEGVLGLGFRKMQSIQPVQQNTFFDNIRDSLAAPLFATALRYNAPGTYDFGVIDTAKYTGELTWTEVNESIGCWEVYVSSTSIFPSTGFYAVVDTGTTLLILGDELVAAYYDDVPDSVNDPTFGGYVVPCDTELPDLEFELGGGYHVVPGMYMMVGAIDETGGMCYGGLQSNDLIDGVNVLGDIFMKGKYIVHEYADGLPRMGIAPLADP
ncbi:aspartic endopeptidase pep1 [Pyrenophora seminiperda CCB06]|uniref:Aspartic endopeptidase pep1 n=1 Tax=Pyrenophora seminiperda CCB06 TaxID=1302712 RepID=A0A3M7M308_9PLEO|nr:aspartic endopeptidase pep1 [Pyrenophora seminiperda CCB06]